MPAISIEEIKDETAKDVTLQEVMKSLASQKWPSSLVQYQALSKELGISNGVLIREERLILPEKLRSRALKIAHCGHPGKVTMKRSLREKVWWPGFDRDIDKEVEECLGCRAVSRQDPPEPMQRRDLPERAWEEIAIDFFSVQDYPTLLIVVDYFSRFVEVVEMKKGTSASKTIEALDSIFDRHYFPDTIQIDNGQPFPSEEMKDFCIHKGIKRIKTIPYWPQMNGEVERQNKGILRTPKIAKIEKRPWREALKNYLTMYNTSAHTVTGKSPFELMMGRPEKLKIPQWSNQRHFLYVEIKDRDAVEKLKGKLYADGKRRAKDSEIEVGDKVMTRNFKLGKIEPNFSPKPFTVVSKLGSDTIIQNDEGQSYRRHISHLKSWPDQAPDANVTSRSPAKKQSVRRTSTSPPPTRPVRSRNPPKRFQPARLPVTK